jgi:AcrR family transcriptional regulator
MGEAGEIELPRSLKLLWGREEPQRRGPKPGLSLQGIAAAAIKVADAEGLDGVSMSRVADQLGVTTMALYRYLNSKDDLVALMLDVAGGRPNLPADAAKGWRERLERWSWDYLAVLSRHPWITRIPISGPPITPNQVAWMEAALAALSATPLTEAEQLSVLLLVSNYVRSVGQLSADIDAAQRALPPEQRSVMSRYGRMLAQLIDAENFPTLCNFLASGVFDQPDDEPDVEFNVGLQILLDGVALLVQERQSQA